MNVMMPVIWISSRKKTDTTVSRRRPWRRYGLPRAIDQHDHYVAKRSNYDFNSNQRQSLKSTPLNQLAKHSSIC